MDKDYEDIEVLEDKLFELKNKNYELENKYNKLKQEYKSIKYLIGLIIFLIIVSFSYDKEIIIDDYSSDITIKETKYWGVVKNHNELRYSSDIEMWEIKKMNEQGEYYWDEFSWSDYYGDNSYDDN